MKEKNMMMNNDGYNKVEFGEGTFEEVETGSEVNFSGMGRIIEKDDGRKCIEVTAINNIPVATTEPQEEAPELSDEEMVKNTEESTAGLKGKLTDMMKDKENMYS